MEENTTTPTIRIDEIRDPERLGVVKSLAAQIFPRTYEDLIPPEQIPYMMNLMYDDAVLRREFDEGMRFAIITENDRPIGYISWHLREADGEKILRLEKIYLDFACHGRSIGNLGLRFVIDEAKRAGADFISLNVNKRNFRAQKAYLRAGFRRWRSETEDVGRGFVKDDYVMRYDLAP